MLFLTCLFTLILISNDVNASWKSSWYPVFIPTSSEKSHRHATLLVSHPIFKKKIIVVERTADSYPYHHSSHSNKDYQRDHDHGASYRYGYHKGENNNDRRHDYSYDSFDDARKHHFSIQDYPKLLYSSKRDPYIRYRTPKYSVPEELSPWRPITIPWKGYSSYKYQHHDEWDEDMEPDPKPHLIMPIGMPQLHNPSIRRPASKYSSPFYGKNDILGVHYAESQQILTKPQFKKNNKYSN